MRGHVQAGDRIGKYVVDGLLGQGGNGAVYRARDSVLGRAVALKLLKPELVHDATMLGRFRDEAEAMAQLNHPNVLTVFDFVGAGNDWAIVMELVEDGEDLEALLARDEPVDVVRALRIVGDAARGLGHAHRRGIVHRDVKPGNILLVRDGDTERAKVSDFGIARLTGRARRTRDSVTLGTVYYMAPEQAQDSGVDARADVYALGATLYRLVTGRAPFVYDSPGAVLTAHVYEAPMSPRVFAPALPREVEDLVMDCLAKRPDERPADGDALATRVEAIAPRISRQSIPSTRHHPSHPRVTPTPGMDRPPAPSPAGGPTAESLAAHELRETQTGLMVGVGVALLAGAICLAGAVGAWLACS